MSLGVGVIGAGTVGGGVIQTLLNNHTTILDKAGVQVALRHVADINTALFEPYNLGNVRVSADAGALIDDPEVHVVCELIGGVGAAKALTLRALNAKKHVVTANKMLIALHGPELCEVAIANGVELRYEAAVAGTIPIIKTLREAFASNNVQGIYGILNGTCNYILTRMSVDGLDFNTVLKQAQDMGFAETPPDLDILGHDTAHKCQILASLAYNTKVDLDKIFVEGITRINALDVAYAKEMGRVIKLLAVIRKIDGEIEARVHPTLVPETHLLASVVNEFNGIYVECDIADATLYYGRGAGRLPTASAVVSDIVDIARAGGRPAEPPFRYTHELKLRDIGLLQGRYYLRLTTANHPGVLGRVATILGNHGVDIAYVLQKEEDEDAPTDIIMTTDETVESKIKAAVLEIDALEDSLQPTHVIRMLE